MALFVAYVQTAYNALYNKQQTYVLITVGVPNRFAITYQTYQFIGRLQNTNRDTQKECAVLAMKIKLTLFGSLSCANKQTRVEMYFSLAYGVTCKKLCSYLPESEPLQHYHVTFSKPRLSRHIFQDDDVGYTPPKCSRTRGFILAPNYRDSKLSDHSLFKLYYA